MLYYVFFFLLCCNSVHKTPVMFGFPPDVLFLSFYIWLSSRVCVCFMSRHSWLRWSSLTVCARVWWGSARRPSGRRRGWGRAFGISNGRWALESALTGTESKGWRSRCSNCAVLKAFFLFFLPSSPGDTPDAGVPVALNKVVQNIYNLNVTQLDPSFIAYNRYDGSYLWARTRLCFFQHQ